MSTYQLKHTGSQIDTAVSTVENLGETHYTKNEVDSLLSQYVKYKTLTVDVSAPTGDSTVLSGVVIKVYDLEGNLLDTKTYNGSALAFRLPMDGTFRIVASTSISVGGITYFSPKPSVESGALTEDTYSKVSYASTSSMETLQDVKAFLALDSVSLADKQSALVATETNSFEFDMTITDPEASKTYTMPVKVMSVGTMKKLVNGEEVEYLGAICMFKYCIPYDIPLDQREQVRASGTFQSGLYYYYGTSSTAIVDQAFTTMTAGTDYTVGDSISTWESNNSGKYVYVHGQAPGSGNTSTNMAMRYGSNVYHESNVDQWLNASGTDWFSARHVGDVLASWYVGKHGFEDWFSASDLDDIEDNVSWGVYEKDGHTTDNNVIYRRFTLPSVTNLAGSANSLEGDCFAYWKYLNGGSVSNSANSTRVIQKVSSQSSNSYMWTRSPNRSNCYSWNLNTSGYLSGSGTCYTSSVAPLFSI